MIAKLNSKEMLKQLILSFLRHAYVQNRVPQDIEESLLTVNGKEWVDSNKMLIEGITESTWKSWKEATLRKLDEKIRIEGQVSGQIKYDKGVKPVSNFNAKQNKIGIESKKCYN